MSKNKRNRKEKENPFLQQGYILQCHFVQAEFAHVLGLAEK